MEDKLLNISKESLQKLTAEQMANLKVEITDLLQKIDSILEEDEND